MERDDAGAFALMTLVDRLAKAYDLCDSVCAAQQDVTAAQGRTLLALPPDVQVRMNELSDTLGLATSTTTRMVDQLVGKGLVLRLQDERDRRVVRVILTEQGRQVRRALEQARQDFFQLVLDEIKRTERWSILYALEKVASSVDKALRVFGTADVLPR
ncbi:MAG: MarR family transcriptional regulator [Chloroflexi bacterium]|nr:MarR family transcriptional regulator [Chloroflexota bacterium]